MEIGTKNLVTHLTINIYLEVLEKNWLKYDISVNNRIRYDVFLFANL